MRPRIVLFVSFLFVFVTNIYATNPPNKGNFPNGFWKIALQDQTLLKYGDPGWVKRMEQRRLRQQAAVFAQTAGPLLQADNFVLPVLLGQYSDNAGTFTDQDFQDLLFDNNPTGTMAAYYNEVSYGQFNLTGQVHGWFTSDQTRSYYASNNYGLNSNFPRNGAGFVRNIVGKADPSLNFSLYDNDGPDGVPNSGDDDGYVDGVIVVYAGAGADLGANNLWPHMSWLGDNEFTTNDAAANGGMIKVNTYAVCPERAGNGSGANTIRPIGVFAHEFGHILGLPDLYDHTNSSAGIGYWCLMAYGSWGGDGAHSERPAHMSAWCKIQMGWVTPTLVTENANGRMIRQAENNPEAYMLWEDGYQMPWENGYPWNRYFLIENRQRTGFDEYLNGTGLLIFHIDENRRWGRIRWSGGPLNDDERHKLVDLEEADARVDLDRFVNGGDGGDPFPGTNNNRAFTHASNPNSRDYDDVSTGVEIKNISAPGAIMTADMVVRQPLGYALAYDENGITDGFTTAQNSWIGVQFTTQQAGVLTAIDLGVLSSSTNPYEIKGYEIKVYSSFNGTQPSNLLTTVSGQARANEWHTIPIQGGVVLPANRDFFVSVKMNAHSYDRFGQASGRSYFSSDGITFNSLISAVPNGRNLNIRARILQGDSPTITVTAPAEGAVWTVGSVQMVTWNSSGVSGNVNTKLSTNGGLTFPFPLVQNTSNDGSESIPVPNNLSNMCRVRVESISNTNVFGDNPGYFTIANLSVTFTTSPSGRQIVVDGMTYTAPRTFTNWSVGSPYTIGVTSPQSSGSATQYVFSSWSDSGSQFHTITAPTTNTIYTANFTTQYQLTVNANPSSGGTTNPSGQSWQDSGVNVPISATPNSGYSFTGWSGSATGTNNPVTVTMNAPKIVTANFAANVAMPTFSPAPGTYASAQNVTLSCATAGATIRYTTNGSDPTGSSPAYTSPLQLSSTTTIKARGYLTGLAPSSVATGTYTITGTVATPTFSPAPGTYMSVQNVSLLCASSGATIRYTMNGSDPTESSLAYTSPILVSSTATIKAKGYLSGWTPSSVASGVYTIMGTSGFCDDFSNGAAESWSPQNANYWEVVADEGDFSYHLRTPYPGGDEFALIEGLMFADFDMTIQVKSGNSSGGNLFILFGLQTYPNGYYLQFAQGGTKLYLTTGGPGTEVLIAQNDNFRLADSRYHTIRIIRQGNSIQVYGDGTQACNLNNGTFQVGQIGIGAWKETAYFDDISINQCGSTTNRTLTVASSNPDSGVNITVSPNDNNGQSNGITQFTRAYNDNIVVTLAAPATASGNNFQKWLRNGADYSLNRTTTVAMNTDYTMTAVFVSNPSITVTTNPIGRPIIVAGTTYIAPQTFTNWPPGSQRTIGVTSPQSGGSTTQYLFSSWSDGGSQFHTITAPSTDTTYTANFTTQYQLAVNANPSSGGTTNPSGQNWRDSGVNVSISVTPNSGYFFAGWSGDATGTNSPVNVTMNAPKNLTANFARIIAAPTLISPANGAGNQSTTLTLSWNPVTDTETYRLQVSTSSAFTATIFDDSNITSASQQIDSLTKDTTYYWRVNAKNVGGTSAWSEEWSFTTRPTAVSETGKVTPTEFGLSQNYPNPFNPSTTILYALPQTAFVRLTVFNSSGKEVETLVSTTQVAGEYEIHWNLNNLTSGVYFYRLQAGKFVETRKMVLMR